MTKHSLEALVKEDESQTLEFKESLSLKREGLEALYAMVNSDLAHGTVVFGVEQDRSDGRAWIRQGTKKTHVKPRWKGAAYEK